MTHVRTQAHELRANLTWDQHGVTPYWSARTLYQAFDGHYDGTVTVEDEEWHLSLTYDPSGVAPRPSDTVDRLYEYRLKAEGEGHRSIAAKLQPRFDEMHKFDTEAGEPERDEQGDRVPIQGVPNDLGEAVNWRVNPAVNVEPEDVPRLLSALLKAVADDVGHRWDPAFFRGRPHRYSSVWEYERYVRLRRDCTSKLIDPTGTLSRIRELLADQQGAKMEISIDNTGKNRQVEGYNHQYRLNEWAANQLLPGGQRGKQFKHYHPEYVNSDEENPLYHPKFGVLFKKSWSRSSVPWRELDELTHELEENLVNVLSWSGLPVKPGSPTFVSDDHFNASDESDLEVGWYDDPTPEIESQQDSLFVRAVTDLTDGGEDVLRQLVADGGTADYDDLADEAGVSVSTLYRALDHLDELVTSDNGSVSFVGDHVRRRFEAVFQRVEDAVATGAKAAARVLDMDPRRIEEQGSAFQAWLNEYAVDVVESSPDAVKLKIGATLSRLKSTSAPTLEDVLEYGRICWNRSGRGDALSWHDVEIVAEVDNTTECIAAGRVLPG